jgi:pyruvate,water dikinase
LSSGKYIGQARVVLDPTSIDSFKWGDILVTHSTNPSWTPLFTLAGAIVTDMGNYLSHGAIVARELGIPAVGNIFTATQAIKTGEMVYVDGDNGIVRKVFEV